MISSPTLDQLESQIAQAMIADRQRLRNGLRGCARPLATGKPLDPKRLARLEEQLRQSIGRCARAAEGGPAVHVRCGPADFSPARGDRRGDSRSPGGDRLRRDRLRQVDATAQDLPGNGPRRCRPDRPHAAAADCRPQRGPRIAEEIGSPLGRDVGYKVRFSESLGPQSYIKLMTDGILLAEHRATRISTATTRLSSTRPTNGR